MKALLPLCLLSLGLASAGAVENAQQKLRSDYLMEQEQPSRAEPQREGTLPGESVLQDGTRVSPNGEVRRPDGTTFHLGPNQRMSPAGDLLEGTQETPDAAAELPAVKQQ